MGGISKRLKARLSTWSFLNPSPAVHASRRQLDEVGKHSPSEGWIKRKRIEHGLSMRALSDRIGTTGNSVYLAEKREVQGTISIGQLQRFAAAMNCKLVYGFVPEGDEASELSDPKSRQRAVK